jgi:hypothetical protein
VIEEGFTPGKSKHENWKSKEDKLRFKQYTQKIHHEVLNNEAARKIGFDQPKNVIEPLQLQPGRVDISLQRPLIQRKFCVLNPEVKIGSHLGFLEMGKPNCLVAKLHLEK